MWACYEGLDFPSGTNGQNLSADAGDARGAALIPESERSPGVGNGTPLQYSCLENSIGRGLANQYDPCPLPVMMGSSMDIGWRPGRRDLISGLNL